MEVGSIFPSNQYGDVIVKRVLPDRKIEVEFVNTGTIKLVRKDTIISGQIRDNFAPKTYGVGYIGEGNYTTTKSVGMVCLRDATLITITLKKTIMVG